MFLERGCPPPYVQDGAQLSSFQTARNQAASPQFSLPVGLKSVDPAWANCKPFPLGALDPPRTLQPVDIMGPTTEAAATKKPTASPASSVPDPLPVMTTPSIVQTPSSIQDPKAISNSQGATTSNIIQTTQAGPSAVAGQADLAAEEPSKSEPPRTQIPDSQPLQIITHSNGNGNGDLHGGGNTKPTPLPKSPMINPILDFFGLGVPDGKGSSTTRSGVTAISNAEPMRSDAHWLSASPTMNGVGYGSSNYETASEDLASANDIENSDTAASEYANAASQSEWRLPSGGTGRTAYALNSAGSPLTRPTDTQPAESAESGSRFSTGNPGGSTKTDESNDAASRLTGDVHGSGTENPVTPAATTTSALGGIIMSAFEHGDSQSSSGMDRVATVLLNDTEGLVTNLGGSSATSSPALFTGAAVGLVLSLRCLAFAIVGASCALWIG